MTSGLLSALLVFLWFDNSTLDRVTSVGREGMIGSAYIDERWELISAHDGITFSWTRMRKRTENAALPNEWPVSWTARLVSYRYQQQRWRTVSFDTARRFVPGFSTGQRTREPSQFESTWLEARTPWWLAFLVIATPWTLHFTRLVPRLARNHRERTRVAKGMCAKCGYSRYSLAPSAPCPECGHTPSTIASDEPNTTKPPPQA